MGARSLLGQKLFTARTLIGAGAIRPIRPDRLARVGLALHRLGPTPAGGYTVSAIRHPDAPAIVDERGTLTFAEVHRRTNALSHALRDAGLSEGDGAAILCRNHRGFVDATIACSKLGVDLLFLNTAFAAPQITEVAERESPAMIIYDAEFGGLIAEAGQGRRRFVAWADPGETADDPTLDELIARGDPSDLRAPKHRSRVVILTSGTTGRPKGARRHQPKSLDPAAALFDRIPLRARERTLIAAPLFHSWGLAHFTLGMALSSTLVLPRRFDPEDTLRTLAQERCSAFIAVPVMLQRMLELPDDVFARLRPERAARHRAQRQLAARRAGHARHGPLRRRALQPLRLDRGGVGVGGHPGRPARRARHGRPSAARHRGQAARRAGRRGRPGRAGPDLRRQ